MAHLANLLLSEHWSGLVFLLHPNYLEEEFYGHVELTKEKRNVFTILFFHNIPMTEALYLIFPMCSRAAKSFKISQISWSENKRTFIADLMSANSAASSLPSHVIDPPWKNNFTKNKNYLCN